MTTNKEMQDSLIKALKCSHEELQELFMSAIREAVILEVENNKLKQCIIDIKKLVSQHE